MDMPPETLALQERPQVFLWGAIVVEAQGPGIALVHVTGRLDLRSAPDLQRCLVATIHSGRRRLVVDLGETTFVDSAGVRTLVDILQLAHRAGGTLRLARPGVQARLILQLTAVDHVLPSYETAAQALSGL